ncbi:MAG: hypothetical protein ACK6D3_20080 [Planctomycetaceae bacterium]|jgi:hypothetical protein
MKIGLSTGSLAGRDLWGGLERALSLPCQAIELSALREEELDPLLRSLDRLDVMVAGFESVAVHVPSRIEAMTESRLVRDLQPIVERDWIAVVHPNLIQTPMLWRALGSALCIENMDKRKTVGRTARQLLELFAELPDATFCFDIGHARQVDPTMLEASRMVESLRGRMRQIHMSHVNSASRHERLKYESILAYRQVASALPCEIPIILESCIPSDGFDDEVFRLKQVFTNDAIDMSPHLSPRDSFPRQSPARVMMS